MAVLRQRKGDREICHTLHPFSYLSLKSGGAIAVPDHPSSYTGLCNINGNLAKGEIYSNVTHSNSTHSQYPHKHVL